MEILGHSQTSVTLNTYTHVDASLTETALNGMESALSRQGSSEGGSSHGTSSASWVETRFNFME
jgi:hypothetical protein